MEESYRDAESRKWKPFFRFLKLRKKRASGKEESSASASSLSNSATEIPISSIEESPDVFTDKMAYEFVWDYHEQFRLALEADTESLIWKDFWPNYHTDDFLFVRPSGNSLTLRGMIAELETGNVTNYEEDVIMVENIKCLGQVAVLVYKSETRLFYEGTRVEDSRTNTGTIVIVWQDGRPKITNIQRSQGRKDND